MVFTTWHSSRFFYSERMIQMYGCPMCHDHIDRPDWTKHLTVCFTDPGDVIPPEAFTPTS
jgi:hypothetical protein